MELAVSATIFPPNSNHYPNVSNNYRSVPPTGKRFPKIRNPRKSPESRVFAKAGRDGSNDNGGGGERRSRKTAAGLLNQLRWRDLLNPDPENIVAVGLAGLLTWASVQVLWQLLFISFAILAAALKYSFIAALLLFVLITLL